MLSPQADLRMMMRKLLLALAGLFVATAAFAQDAPSTASQAPVAPPAVDQENIWNLDLSSGGRVAIQLRPDKAPAHVERIKTLTRQHFYDGLVFHRVIDGFMAQGGDPKGTGEGGSELPDLKAEFNDLPHVRGTASMARAEGLDSANSQFFIMFQPLLKLDGKYTVFGRVIGGMEYVDAIQRGEPPANPTRIVRASIGSDNVPPPTAEELKAAPPPPAGRVAPIPMDSKLLATPPEAAPAQATPPQ
jgi:cyclophilin family peptidyl-prolyl cis-trans isomerase